MSSDTSAGTLKSRSYVGLLVAQFLACFNDQAIHYVAFFYADDMLVRYLGMRHFDVKLLAVIVTSCFIAPFLLFSPIAGVLADKFSKRSTIVFWKIAEVGIMGLVFVGFLLPHIALTTANVIWSSAMLLAAVFLMGTHSTFFIPAKYGVMPEILHPSVLSRGNGILEGSSFTGNILGTVFGGLVYVQYHSIYNTQTHVLTLGKEWILGLILLGLAILGAIGAMTMPKLPAADPTRKMEWNPWIPVRDNLRVLRRSRPLVLATIGIAFFTFMTLFFRLVLIFEGETNKDYKEYQHAYQQSVASQRITATPGSPSLRPSGVSTQANPPSSEATDPDEGLLDQLFSDEPSPGDSFADDISLDDLASRAPSISAAHALTQQAPSSDAWEEFRIAILIAFVALGVGVGCATAGMISGDRIELGLVPFGAMLIVLFTALLAYVTGTAWATRATLVGVGLGAGLYIVPLYTLLQHRAPKESKGNLVALSNFLNVTGGLIAVGVFYFITFGLQRIFGLNLSAKDVAASTDKMHEFVLQLQQTTQIPRMLFLAASLITLGMIYLLCRQRPDFLLRTISWFQFPRRRHLHTVGLANVPAEGHVILATNCHGSDAWVCVMSAIDRRTCNLQLEPAVESLLGPQSTRLESFARRLGLFVTPRGTSQADWNAVLHAGVQTLEDGYLVALTLDQQEAQPVLSGPISRNPSTLSTDELYALLQSRIQSTVLPVYCDPQWKGPSAGVAGHPRALVVIGKPLAPDAPIEEIRAAIRAAAAAGD